LLRGRTSAWHPDPRSGQLPRCTLLTILLLAAAVAGCNQKPATETQPHRITVGISYQNLQNEFIINIQDAVRAEAKKLDVDLVESDGQGKAENQISQTENFITCGVDAVILNPYDKEGSAHGV